MFRSRLLAVSEARRFGAHGLRRQLLFVLVLKLIALLLLWQHFIAPQRVQVDSHSAGASALGHAASPPTPSATHDQ